MKPIQLLVVVVPVFAMLATWGFLRGALSLSGSALLFYGGVALVELLYVAILALAGDDAHSRAMT